METPSRSSARCLSIVSTFYIRRSRDASLDKDTSEVVRQSGEVIGPETLRRPPLSGKSNEGLCIIWESLNNAAKHCLRICTSHPKDKLVEEDYIVCLMMKESFIYTVDEAFYAINSLQNHSVLVESHGGFKVRPDIYDDLVELVRFQDQLMSPKKCFKALTFKDLDSKVVHLMEFDPSEQQASPNLPSLTTLYLQDIQQMIRIPPLFFENMAALQELDFSYTDVISLPDSIKNLVALRKLVARRCEMFLVIPPKIGELSYLEELDLEGSELFCLPEEIGKLVKLKRLRLSFSNGATGGRKMMGIQTDTQIPIGLIAKLSQLVELSIDASPEDKRWISSAESVVQEVCHLNKLMTLNLYLPKPKLLKEIMQNLKLSRCKFIVGRYVENLAVKVPLEIQEEYKKCRKCLKFVSGSNFPSEITEALRGASSFYLDSHRAAINLSRFFNTDKIILNFCVLVDCP